MPIERKPDGHSDRHVGDIEQLVHALEALTEQARRAPCIEKAILDPELHTTGLDRLIELLAQTRHGEMLFDLISDPRVRASVSHARDPKCMEAHARQAVDAARLRAQGLRVELKVMDQDTARLRLTTSGDGASVATIRRIVDEAYQRAAPDGAGITERLAELAAQVETLSREIVIPLGSRRETSRS